jgi:hypothetical protein
MKTRTLTIISVALLATMVLGIFVNQALSPAPRLRAKAYFKPNTYDTSNPVPQPWLVWLHFASNDVSASQLDASSILLEGVYAPSGAPYDLPSKSASWVVVPFNGYDVLIAAITKIGHMTVGQSYMVFLTVTGKTIDGTPFDTGSSGAVIIYDPEVSPP